MSLLKDFQYHIPNTLNEALGMLMKASEPTLLGGGTFVLNHLKKSSKYPSDCISLKKIPVLRGIKKTGEDLIIGSMTTITELVESELVKKHFPSLFQAASKCGTTPIRNMATIGGNVASRFFWVDLPTVLISLAAKVSLATYTSEETLGIDEFLSQKPPKKFILTAISIPVQNRLTYYRRHTKAMEVDIPSCALAFAASMADSRLSGVKLIVNTTTSFPVECKVTQAVFENRDFKKIGLNEVRSALKNDLEKTKLDEYRIHCLSVDLENLLK